MDPDNPETCVLCSDSLCSDCSENYTKCTICTTDYILNSEGVCHNCTVDNCDQCSETDKNVCIDCS